MYSSEHLWFMGHVHKPRWALKGFLSVRVILFLFSLDNQSNLRITRWLHYVPVTESTMRSFKRQEKIILLQWKG
jgi:hypothetical protein